MLAMAPKLRLPGRLRILGEDALDAELDVLGREGLAGVERDARLERERVGQAVIAHGVAVGEQRLDRTPSSVSWYSAFVDVAVERLGDALAAAGRVVEVLRLVQGADLDGRVVRRGRGLRGRDGREARHDDGHGREDACGPQAPRVTDGHGCFLCVCAEGRSPGLVARLPRSGSPQAQAHREAIRACRRGRHDSASRTTAADRQTGPERRGEHGTARHTQCSSSATNATCRPPVSRKSIDFVP